MLTIMMKTISPILGGCLSRIVGGGKPKIQGPQFWFAIPYGMIFHNPVWGIPCYIYAAIAKRFGHGQYIGLGYTARQDASNDEWLDIFVKPFFGEDKGGNYWRCAWGLAVTGIALTIPVGTCYSIYTGSIYGAAIALSGITKAASYMIGWYIYNNYSQKIEATVYGEFLTGLLFWSFLMPAI